MGRKAERMSREEVIKLLKLIKSTVYLGNRKFFDALESAISYLRQSEPQWIPVTERLPDKKGHYLATNLGRVYITGFNGEVFGLRHVTAWMPLPEPYKGEK